MRTSFDEIHFDYIINTNLISGIWADVSVANGHIQECGEGKEVESKTEKKTNIQTKSKKG